MRLIIPVVLNCILVLIVYLGLDEKNITAKFAAGYQVL